MAQFRKLPGVVKAHTKRMPFAAFRVDVMDTAGRRVIFVGAFETQKEAWDVSNSTPRAEFLYVISSKCTCVKVDGQLFVLANDSVKL